MNVKQQRRCALALCVGLALAMVAPSAWAFYPVGAFDPFGALRFQTWRFAHFDNNGDGQVTSEEGIEVFIEVGSLGFNQQEVAEVLAGLQVWADVPTSYAQFRLGGQFEDPIIPGTQDGLTTITYAYPTELAEVGLDEFLGGLTLVTSTLSDTAVSINGTTFYVSAGTITDADIVFNATTFRDTDGSGLSLIAPTTLLGVTVSASGFMLGLTEPPPLNSEFDATSGRYLEQANFVLRNPQGALELVGLTSSLDIAGPLTYIDEATDLVDAYPTLAPSDIAGISYLYPRGNQGNFFTFSEKARTQARVDLPSLPLPNALVTAWIDNDNNPNTARVPFASTLTGMFENDLYDERQNLFTILGLWKRINVIGQEGQVDATYTFTISALNGTGVDRLAPEGWDPTVANTIGGSTSETIDQFLSETFNEYGNIIDLSNHDEGTAMTFDSSKGKFVSVDSGKTISEILPGSSPMFGDSVNICPFNIITGGSLTGTTGDGTGTIPDTTGLAKNRDDRDKKGPLIAYGGVGGPPDLPGALRGFRDQWLLQSAVGAAVVDWYYTVAPSISAWMLRSNTNMSIAKAIYNGMAFGLQWRFHLLLPLMVVAWVLRRAFRFRWAPHAAGLALSAALLVNMPAGAQVVPASTADLTALADRIVYVEVAALESYTVEVGGGTRIQTDVSVEVLDNAKGAAAKQSTLTFTIPTGQVGDFVTRSSSLASFEVGERAVLFLAASDVLGWHVLGGFQGKMPVEQSKTTGKEYVKPMHPVQAAALKTVAKSVTSAKATYR